MIDLKIAIKTVMDVLMTTAVYPQAHIEYKEGREIRIERTEWQEGWNAAQREIFNKLNNALGKLEEGISDELSLLMVADVGWMQDGKFILNMNDTFWGCADAEEVNPEEYKEVARLFRKYGNSGLTYWVSKKRNELPQILKYKEEVAEVERMENKK